MWLDEEPEAGGSLESLEPAGRPAFTIAMLGAGPVVEPLDEPALDLGFRRVRETAPEVLPHDGLCRLVQVEGHLHPRQHRGIPERSFHGVDST